MLTQEKERELQNFAREFGSKPSDRLGFGDLDTSVDVCQSRIY